MKTFTSPIYDKLASPIYGKQAARPTSAAAKTLLTRGWNSPEPAALQYHTHKKTPPRRTLQQDYAQGPKGGEAFSYERGIPVAALLGSGGTAW